MTSIERAFQQFLWNARLIMVIPVLASLLSAVVILLLSALNTVALVQRMISYIGLSTTDQASQSNLILSDVIGVIDQYLIVVIFADGLYELFIGKISVAESSPIGARLLVVKSLDDLKDRLVSVVLVILVVKFFQQALKMKYETPTDLLLLAGGIAAIGAALYLTKKNKPSKPASEKGPSAE
jgi:uncharacterized membrane protein YqhA